MSDRDTTSQNTDLVTAPLRWQRLLYMILYGVIAYLLIWLVLFMALLQFLVVLLTGRPNRNLRDFANRLDAYFGHILAFLSFNSDTVPFPFSPFPGIPDRGS